MNAVDFVKKHGWEYAKHILSDDAPLVMDLDYNELKRLVDSWELVESYGGIPMAKRQLSLFLRVNSERCTDQSVRVTNLKQAVEDMESVNESKNQKL